MSLAALGGCSEETPSGNPGPTQRAVGQAYGGTVREATSDVDTADFDEGGEGVAYHDQDEVNHCGGERSGPDECGDGVGWVDTGDWLNFTLDFSQSGAHRLSVDCWGPNNDGGRISAYLDGQVIGSNVACAHTAPGDWNMPADGVRSVGTINVSAGLHLVTIRVDQHGMNFGRFRFSYQDGGGYVGCFTDSFTRALAAEFGNDHSVESCINAVKSAGYTYAGLQWYGECRGGNSLGYEQVSDAECDTPCSANPAQMCGGAWRNSIYATDGDCIPDGSCSGTCDGGSGSNSCGEPCTNNEPCSVRGHVRIDPAYPNSFKFDNDERFFPFGDTSYRMMGASESVIAAYIDSRSANQFNFIRFPAITGGFWPFGGSPEDPDFYTIDEGAMQKLDWVFDYAASRDVYIELIVWGYEGGGGNGMWGNQELEELWVDTLVNRYKNRTNLFMWTVTNEYERYPDWGYSYAPSDTEWAQSVVSRIRNIDTIHAAGVHAAAGLDSSALVVWPLWQGSEVNVFNVFSRSGHMDGGWETCPTGYEGANVRETVWDGITYTPTWDGSGWDFEAPGIEDGIAEDWWHGKPVVNTEFGYQTEAGVEYSHPNWMTCQLYTPATLRRTAWKTATAGGSIAAGFVHTVKAIDESKIDVFRPEQLQTLYRFITGRTEYWKMAPHLEWVAAQNSLLARYGEEYVAYFPRGGTNWVHLAAGNYTVEWLHPESGDYTSAGVITVSEGAHDFTPPYSSGSDWVLHLTGA